MSLMSNMTELSPMSCMSSMSLQCFDSDSNVKHVMYVVDDKLYRDVIGVKYVVDDIEVPWR